MKLPRALCAVAFPTVVVLTFWATACWAGPLFYVDAGAGYVQMKNSGTFFNSSNAGSASGYGLNLGFFSTLTARDPAMSLHLGIENRYDSATSSGISDGLNMPYAAARLQLSRLFVTLGYCPYVWQSIGGASAENQTLSHVPGAYALLGEAGLLLPVTPGFSFSVSGAYESVSDNGVKSPSPILSGSLGMRFYFDFGSGGGESNEFHGWRYPFGHEME